MIYGFKESDIKLVLIIRVVASWRIVVTTIDQVPSVGYIQEFT